MAFWREKGRFDGLGIGNMKYARAVTCFLVSMFEALIMSEVFRPKQEALGYVQSMAYA